MQLLSQAEAGSETRAPPGPRPVSSPPQLELVLLPSASCYLIAGEPGAGESSENLSGHKVLSTFSPGSPILTGGRWRGDHKIEWPRAGYFSEPLLAHPQNWKTRLSPQLVCGHFRRGEEGADLFSFGASDVAGNGSWREGVGVGTFLALGGRNKPGWTEKGEEEPTQSLEFLSDPPLPQ